jgi:Cu-processing system permease protein
VTRSQVVLGKFIGHTAILAIATAIGYGAAGAILALTDGGDAATWPAFVLLVGTSILLGTVFIAVGYLVSALVRDRGTAGGIAIGVWLLFALIYDMVLLGVLVADQGRNVTAGMVNWLLLLNPSDAFRLFNLAGTPGVSSFSGLAGLTDQMRLAPATLVVALGLWVAVPLAATIGVFSRREI